MAVAKTIAESASEKAAASALLVSKRDIVVIPLFKSGRDRERAQAMRPAGLAGTIAAAMTIAEKAKAAMAASALLAFESDIFLFPLT